MSTRSTRFFAMEQEFLDILNEIIKSQKLYIIHFRRVRNATIKLIDFPLELKRIKDMGIHDIYLGEKIPNFENIDPKNVLPALNGWVSITFPREIGKILYLGDLGVRSEWWDKNPEVIFDNPDCLKLFNKVATRLKKHLKFGMWICDTEFHPIRLTKSIGFTKEVREFNSKGGELMQEGVLNIRYICDPMSF